MSSDIFCPVVSIVSNIIPYKERMEQVIIDYPVNSIKYSFSSYYYVHPFGFNDIDFMKLNSMKTADNGW